MKEKFKLLILAFSGIIIRSTLSQFLCDMMSNDVYATLIANIAVVILGGIYLNTVIGEYEPKVFVRRRYITVSMITMLIYSVVSMYTSNFLFKLLYTDEAQAAYSASQNHGEYEILSLCISVFLVPIAEEIVYRGFLFRFISKNTKAAMIISSLIFALMHGTVVHLYTAFIGGMILCNIYAKTHKLRYNIMAHVLFNGITVILSLIPYPFFGYEPWWIVTLNAALVLVLFMFVHTDANEQIRQPEAITDKKQQADIDETRHIVDEVLAEYKNKRH